MPEGTPTNASGSSDRELEKKLRRSVADWQEKRVKEEEEEKGSPEPSLQELAIEPEAALAVEPAAQTAEAVSGAPKEELDAAQRVARDLAADIPEGTPQELRGLLRNLVEKVESASTKGGERLKGLKEHLAHRLSELNGEARQEGAVGQSFRLLGERYDKLDRKTKLAVGLTLGLGAGALSAVSLPEPLRACPASRCSA